MNGDPREAKCPRLTNDRVSKSKLSNIIKASLEEVGQLHWEPSSFLKQGAASLPGRHSIPASPHVQAADCLDLARAGPHRGTCVQFGCCHQACLVWRACTCAADKQTLDSWPSPQYDPSIVTAVCCMPISRHQRAATNAETGGRARPASVSRPFPTLHPHLSHLPYMPIEPRIFSEQADLLGCLAQLRAPLPCIRARCNAVSVRAVSPPVR